MDTNESPKEGYLDKRTIESLENPDLAVSGDPPTGTMWFNRETGTIYRFGSSRPQDTYSNDNVIPINILYGGKHGLDGPIAKIPEWVTKPEEVLGGLETALASIRDFKKEETNK